MTADILAQDRAGRDALLVEVKNRELSLDLVSLYFQAMEAECPSIPFKMVVDSSRIYIEKRGPGASSSTSSTMQLVTSEILRGYEPEIDKKRISPR